MNFTEEPKTVKKYADYLWVLGGELIRRVSTDEKARKLPARTLILKGLQAFVWVRGYWACIRRPRRQIWHPYA